MSASIFPIALVLGLLTAISPLAIDMYLPALPSIGRSLGASVGGVQASLMAYFVAMGIGQNIYGPLSDSIGRKAPMYLGLLLFIGASIGCALAPNIQTLIFCRFLQGSGACAVTVVPRAMVRDLHTGSEAARLMARLMLVFSISPILAPLAGSLLIERAGWRSVFWAIAFLAVLGLVLLAFHLPETGAEPRQTRGSRRFRSSYGALLRDRSYLRFVAIGALCMSCFFVYLANSSFVLINHYGLTPRQYSIAFSVNAISFIGAAQLTGRLGRRFGLRTVLKRAICGNAAVMSLLLVLIILGIDRLGLLVILLFIGYGFIGLVAPITAVLALDEQGPIAGTASALMGTINFLTGTLVVSIMGMFGNCSALPMVATITACSISALILAGGPLGRDLKKGEGTGGAGHRP